MVHWIGVVNITIQSLEGLGFKPYSSALVNSRDAVCMALHYLKKASEMYEKETQVSRAHEEKLFTTSLEYEDRFSVDRDYIWVTNNDMGSFEWSYSLSKWVWFSNNGRTSMVYSNPQLDSLVPEHFPMRGKRKGNNVTHG